jgi:hypothetical protein
VAASACKIEIDAPSNSGARRRPPDRAASTCSVPFAHATATKDGVAASATAAPPTRALQISAPARSARTVVLGGAPRAPPSTRAYTVHSCAPPPPPPPSVSCAAAAATAAAAEAARAAGADSVSDMRSCEGGRAKCAQSERAGSAAGSSAVHQPTAGAPIGPSGAALPPPPPSPPPCGSPPPRARLAAAAAPACAVGGAKPQPPTFAAASPSPQPPTFATACCQYADGGASGCEAA